MKAKRQSEEEPPTKRLRQEFFEHGKKRISVRDFKGTTYVDIREFYEKEGEMLPGKKGISLKVEEWEWLLSLRDSINDLINK